MCGWWQESLVDLSSVPYGNERYQAARRPPFHGKPEADLNRGDSSGNTPADSPELDDVLAPNVYSACAVSSRPTR